MIYLRIQTYIVELCKDIMIQGNNGTPNYWVRTRLLSGICLHQLLFSSSSSLDTSIDPKNK